MDIYFPVKINLKAVLWIRISMDMNSFSLLDPDPHLFSLESDLGGENLRTKLKNSRKLEIICILLRFVS